MIINAYQTNGVKERKNLYGYGDVHDAWGFAADNVFFVTNDGQALHYNGSPVWVDSITGIDNPLNGVWGVNDESVFAVGADGIIIHYDVNNQKSSITLINGV